MYLEFLAIKNDYIKASRRAFACGLAAASGGNISARLPGSGLMLIKPSGITLGDADERNLLITDLEGNVIEGNQKPTKETILHGEIYRKMPETGGIVHAHPLYSLMCANCFDQLPLVTKQMKQITDSPVPICKIKSLTVEREGMEEICKSLEQVKRPCGFLLEEHGVVAFAGNVTEAEYAAELIEENARVYWNMKLMERAENRWG
ncbi:MAG: class II aldolase/adducin family protein [Clostridium sp.]|nr:class II aldolase/adducin family protein [Clostridium sp.]